MKAQMPAMECLEAVVNANILPWQINVKWSEEAPTILGDVPDRPPRKMSQAAMQNSFRILRITNQGVKDLDKSVKHFIHLEKLILTANNIQKVDSRFLPPNLEFLELCANDITSLSPICLRPPPLTHLGCGYNRVRTLEGCISASMWPRLLSLDLSFNDLDDLHDVVVGKLRLLPSLRSLLLLGNPLSLAPGYRGFVVDFLKDLLIFDDVFISAEERDDFEGLAVNKAIVQNAARVTLEALTVRGISAPTDEKPSDDNTEYPIVSRKYALYFLLPLDAKEVIQERVKAAAAAAKAEADAAAAEAALSSPAGETPDCPRPVVPVILEGHGSLTGSVTYPAEDAAAAEEGDEEQEKPKKKIPLPKVDEEIIVVPEGNDGEYAVKPTKTNPVSWAEEIDLGWKKEIDRHDLLVTRNFFKKGMEVHVVEEKVLAYPSDQIEGLESRGASPGDGARSAASKAAGGGSKSRAEGAKGGKDAKGGGATAGGSGADRKKKKGDTEVDLYYMPPEVSVLAKFRVNMKEFLDGETELDFLFCKEGEKESIVKTAKRDKEAKEEKERESKEKRGGGAKGGAAPPPTGKKEEEAGKKGGGGGGKAAEEKPPASKQASERGGKSSATAKSSKGGEKGGGAGAGGKGERVGTAENIAEELALPPPLECRFKVCLTKWKKTQDAAPPVVVEKKKTTPSKGGRTSGARSAKPDG